MVTPIIGHADVRVSVPVILSAAAPAAQVHWMFEYTADAALPGTLKPSFASLSVQIPSSSEPVRSI